MSELERPLRDLIAQITGKVLQVDVDFALLEESKKSDAWRFYERWRGGDERYLQRM